MEKSNSRPLAVVFAGDDWLTPGGLNLSAGIVENYLHSPSGICYALGNLEGLDSTTCFLRELLGSKLTMVDMQELPISILNRCNVIVVSNVSNPAEKVAIRNWLREKAGNNVMIVAGRYEDRGQVWVGHWIDQDTIHDWLFVHPEIEWGPVKTTEAFPSNLLGNAATEYLTALALEEALQYFKGTPINAEWQVTERYWSGCYPPEFFTEKVKPHTVRDLTSDENLDSPRPDYGLAWSPDELVVVRNWWANCPDRTAIIPAREWAKYQRAARGEHPTQILSELLGG